MSKRKSLKRMRFLTSQIIKQRQWIERCEQGGISYADGERGIAIRKADETHLSDLEYELETYRELAGEKT